MTTALKIADILLILFATYMGIKQGWAMLVGKPAMIEMFRPWNLGRTAMVILGFFAVLSAVFILFPKTFLWGNYIAAAAILFIMMLQLQQRNLKGFAIEVPFFLLSLVILYLQHPLAKSE
ncbi:hypothetical protein [Ohtaekwangia koreensis]|uniref:DoxX-like family protein n=1 Tax=Ohtaekwangia koreensis TaxID=688867 RepID=A0A1T5K1T2_9BACT|nr:hypothetical protein [Ohtaekwangia koreensis]SKC57485.1 hypothetical protein SAMN05660236_1708 [Ohtaekwangia koreensis]